MSEWKNKKGRYVLVTMLLVLLVTVLDIQSAKAAVRLSDSSVNLCVGDTCRLKVTGTTKKIVWKSSKTSVAKVSSKGLVTARGKGSATITATVDKKSYSCKVKVNKTFKVDRTSISIKRNEAVNAYFSLNGSIRKSVANDKICSVEFGKWDGDFMAITIVPKKVGSTTIKFSNSENKEYCTLQVKVTALPAIASFQNAVISTGADTVIAGENELSVPFSLDHTAQKTYLKIYDENNAVVRSIFVGALKANKKKTVVWDGRDDDGNPLGGTFTYAVIADGNRTDAKGAVKALAASPFGKGDGTEKNPYRVSNLAELYLIKDYNGSNFAQDADIDFDYAMTDSLFDSTDPFSGIYDGSYEGKNYRMINLCGNNSVFGSIGSDGVVKNVSLGNCVLNTIGSLLAFTNQGMIDNCTVDSTSKVLCNAGNQAAMLVMYNKGVIRECKVYGSLHVKAFGVSDKTTLKAGGIACHNSGTIAKCSSSVQIVQEISVQTYVPDTKHEIYSGGIVAENELGSIVIQCSFTGSVSTELLLPDNVKDLNPYQAYTAYSGFVAGINNGYIGNCSNEPASGLNAQGTGNGSVQ